MISLNKLLRNIMDYIIVLMMIFRNYSMLSRDMAYGIPEIAMDIVLVGACLIFVFIRVCEGKISVSRQSMLGTVAATVAVLFCVCIPVYNVVEGIICYAGVLIAGVLYFAFHPQPLKFWRIFVNVMTAMAIISLILFFAGTVFNIISPSRIASYEYYNQTRSCNTYFGLQYEAQASQALSLFKYRNCGFFIEAPMYNILLCFALAAELAFSVRVRKKVVLALVVTILTTLTTTGLVFLIVMMVTAVLSAEKGKQTQLIKVIIVPLALLLGLIAILTFIESKTSSVSGSASMSIRMDHMVSFLKMWIDHPIFGVGYKNMDVFFEYANYDQGYSVGLPALLGMYGILMFMVYMLPWIQGVFNSFRSRRCHLFFFFGTFVCFFLTAVINHPIMLLTMAFQIAGNRGRRIV